MPFPLGLRAKKKENNYTTWWTAKKKKEEEEKGAEGLRTSYGDIMLYYLISYTNLFLEWRSCWILDFNLVWLSQKIVDINEEN